MSIAQDPTDYRCDLLIHSPAQDGENQRICWAVYTRSQQEKAVAGQLFRDKIPYYLPVVPGDRVIRGRQCRPFLPLFAGYVFVFATDDEMLLTLKTHRISRVLPVANQDQLRRDLYQVSRLIASEIPLRRERRLQNGQRARVKAGLLRDLEGRIFSHNGRTRLLVAVNFLRQGASIEFDDALVELK